MLKQASVRAQSCLLVGVVGLLFATIAAAAIYANSLLRDAMHQALEARNLETQAIITATSIRAGARQGANTFKTVLLRGNDEKQYKEALADFNRTDKTVRDGVAKLEELAPKIGLDMRDDMRDFLKLHAQVLGKLNAALKLYDPINATTAFLADQEASGVDQPLIAAASRLAERVREHSLKRADAARGAADVEAKRWGWLIGGIMLVGIFGAVCATATMTVLLLRRLGGEPEYAARISSRIASGDLTEEVVVRPGDQASLVASLARMQDGLRTLISQVSDSTRNVVEAAGTVSAATTQISSSSVQQSEAASSMAAAVQQMTVSIDQVSSHSGDALKLSRKSGDLSSEGNQIVQGATEEINGIAASADQLTGIIRNLGEESENITKIVHVIQEIANQTNLLALNAAIEAARAGEQGRGFAVVADEVRKLAERTTESTREIADMVAAIQGGTARAVEHMEGWSERMTEGVAKTRSASERMTAVQDSSNEVVTAVGEIASALGEQASTSTLLAQNVEKIARMSEENSSAVGAVVAQAGRLNDMAALLQGLIAQFRLGRAAA